MPDPTDTQPPPVSPSLDDEVSYISGVTSSGTVAPISFQTWNGDGGDPDGTGTDTTSTYNTMTSNASKWAPGGPSAAPSAIGSPGGTQYYYFDANSNFTAAQQTALISGLSLWSAVANIQFVQVTATYAADNPSLVSLDFQSTTSGGTFEGAGAGTREAINSTTLNNQGAGTFLTVNTDISNGGFDVGNFNNGGSGIGVILHEEGHYLGLGHSGPYNGAVNPATQQFSGYDSHEYSLMSYIGANDPTDKYAASNPNPGATNYGDSTTWMPLDILAIQRLYGAATTGPLSSGGAVFGYHDNIDGTTAGVGIHDYFDFSKITTPVVTLYDSGAGNTLDLSGDNSLETINLAPGTYSSFAGDVDNLAIAYSTAIDTFVGGMAGTSVTVNSDADTITDQGTNNTVNFSGTYNSYVVTPTSPNAVSVTNIATGVTDQLTDAQTLVFSDQTVQTNDMPCYASGTRIATPTGDVRVETLTAGDLVLTASGASRPIRWVGHRRLDTTTHPNPARVWPICIQAGAIADGLPGRDLWVSPGHAIVLQGVLIPACLLVNGRTILQVQRPEIEYWHVELDSHDIILAETLPAETYLDTGNRGGFVECTTHSDLYPEFETSTDAEMCLPRTLSGPELIAAKQALLARAHQLGHEMDEADDLHIIADGRRIEPARLGASRAAFLVPAGCAAITLRSRTFVPAHSNPASSDERQLGVCLNRLQLDGEAFSLEHDASCAAGWHEHEGQPEGTGQRWTTGSVRLPANTQLVVADVIGRGGYWSRSASDVITLFG